MTESDFSRLELHFGREPNYLGRAWIGFIDLLLLYTYIYIRKYTYWIRNRNHFLLLTPFRAGRFSYFFMFFDVLLLA